MIRLTVVIEHPSPDEFRYLVEASAQPGVEDLLSVAAINALDVGVLIGFARFDIVNQHAVGLARANEDLTQELRAVVGSQHIRQPTPDLELLEHAYQPPARQRSSTSMAMQSSSMLKVRSRTPLYSASLMKSANQTWLVGHSATGNGIGSRVGTRCFLHLLRFSFGSQYTR